MYGTVKNELTIRQQIEKDYETFEIQYYRRMLKIKSLGLITNERIMDKQFCKRI